MTRDVSRSGLSMLMPKRPAAAHQDVTVRDGDMAVKLWVRIVDCRAAEGGTHVWHGDINTADTGWSRIVDGSDD